MLTLARILLTLTVLGYGFATIKVDLNKTHAANPTWTPHARFHVVWQILSYTGIGVISLYLIWIAGATSIQPLYLAAAMSVAIYRFMTRTAIRHINRLSARSIGVGTLGRGSKQRTCNGKEHVPVRINGRQLWIISRIL